MEKKQSSVEWLVNQISYKMDIRIEDTTIGCDLFEQAKAMHKDEIKDAYDHHRCIGNFENGEQYYKEKFGGQDNE